jgi:hypothetical protein
MQRPFNLTEREEGGYIIFSGKKIGRQRKKDLTRKIHHNHLALSFSREFSDNFAE